MRHLLLTLALAASITLTAPAVFADDAGDTSSAEGLGGSNVAEIRQHAREEALGCAGGSSTGAPWLGLVLGVPVIAWRLRPPSPESLRRA